MHIASSRMEYENRPVVAFFGGSMASVNSFAASNVFQAASLCVESGYRIAVGSGPGIAQSVREGAYFGAYKKLTKEEASKVIVPFDYSSLEARNEQMKGFDAFIACPGGYGTLFEVALVLRLIEKGEMPKKPVFICGPLGQTLDHFLIGAMKSEVIAPQSRSFYSPVSWPIEAASRLCHSR